MLLYLAPISSSFIDRLVNYAGYLHLLVLSAVVCVNGDLRLQGGANEREGRLEICNNQAWGTVCDNFWDNIDAGVACFQLGYTKAGKGGPINA